MRYKPGDVALTRSPSLVGWAIRLGTRSHYNHARLVVSEYGDVVEALSRGASRGVVRSDDVVVRPPMTDRERAEIPAIGESLLGTPYGFLDVAAIGLAQFGLVLPSVTRRIERPDHLFCSQLVDYAWTLAGFHAFDDGRVPQDVTPGDLADLAFRSGWTVVSAS